MATSPLSSLTIDAEHNKPNADHIFLTKPYLQNPGSDRPVHFIALDTGEDKEDADPAYTGLVDFDTYRKKTGLMAGTTIKKD